MKFPWYVLNGFWSYLAAYIAPHYITMFLAGVAFGASYAAIGLWFIEREV